MLVGRGMLVRCVSMEKVVVVMEQEEEEEGTRRVRFREAQRL